MSSIPPGFKEVEIPRNIIQMFNDTFDETVKRMAIVINDDAEISDALFWKVIVSAKENRINSFDDESNKKITWH